MRSRRRTDLRLVIAALLAVGLLLAVLAVTEYRHHERITRWRDRLMNESPGSRLCPT